MKVFSTSKIKLYPLAVWFVCLAVILSLSVTLVFSLNQEDDNNITYSGYDTDDETAAKVKFTVTFPSGTGFAYKDETLDEENSAATLTLKAEQYTAETEGFNYADHESLINQHMNWHTGVDGSTNDVQFWRVYLVDEEDGNEVDVKLPANGRATVVVEYLDNSGGGALKGALGTRRTCIMDMGDPGIGVPNEDNFTSTDDYALETSYEPGDIGKEDNHYTKITYYIDADNDGISVWGNLTALCSMKLPAAYMQNVTVTSISDGSEPFDAEEADGNDLPGNDSSASNRKVRTFDSVRYTLELISASRSTTGTLSEYVAVAEADLALDITQARFDTTSLSSVFAEDDDWRIEYKDKNGKNLYIENKDGLFQCSDSGGITDTKATINQMANGSSGENPYRTKIASQHLVAYRKMEPPVGSNTAVPSTQTVTVQINVAAAQNGDVIEPEFNVYVKGNKDNFTSEQVDGEYVVSAPSEANKVTAEAVTVSAAARYNMVLKRNNDASYSSYFNFETGKESTAAAGGTYGRILSYGITLQLFNETNVTDKDGKVDGAVLAEKGMRGIELPVGDITFDLSLSGSDKSSPDDYSAILWDYALSIENTKTGLWGRNMLWNNASATTFPKGAAVYSKGGRTNSAYDSGTWSVEAAGNGVENGKTTADITDTGKGVTYTFTVKGFDFDFDNFTFPSESAGNAGKMDWLAPNYIGSFSAGHIQVLQKYPENPKADASPEITAEIKNLKTNSMSGEEKAGEATAVTSEIGGINDNKNTSNVAIYTPGGISKHNSFGKRGSDHGSISSGFLGTDYWGEPNFDAYTFAGSSIYLWGGAQLGRNSDAVVSAYNLLQKFDSRVLSIDTSVDNPVRYTEVNYDSNWPAENWSTNNREGKLKEEAGSYKILYAADPMYPEGWNSNDPAQMTRMNAATEEDLVYFDSLDKLEDRGYTCCAVLLEVRNAEIPAGCYPGLRIAMKVSDNPANINNTVATVNTARMWVKPRGASYNIFGDEKDSKADTQISWENGWMNSLTKEQAKDACAREKTNKITDNDKDLYSDWWGENVTPVNDKLKDIYGSGARYLRTGYNNTNYTKTEYENGTKKKDTHQGYQQGMSLLIIGYESHIGLKVENPDTNQSSDTVTGNVTFEPGKGHWNPLYTITDIFTTPSDPGGQGTAGEKTDLTITASVDNEKGKNQISMSMEPFQVESLVGGQVKWITVSEKEDEPTTVTFKNKAGESVTYQIWAERSGEHDVVFHLTGAPVGETLPDIRFEGQLGADVEHEGQYGAKVTIQGDGDSRALSTGNGNIASINVTTVVLEQTGLIKRVDTNYIELDGEFTYSVSYTNNTDLALDSGKNVYIYDLMPYNGDIRNSSFVRKELITEVSDALTVTGLSGSLTKNAGSAENDNTTVYLYYSTITPTVLRSYVDFAKPQEGKDEPPDNGKDIDQLLRNALLGDDGRGVYYIVKKADFEEAEKSGDFSSLKPVDIYTYDESNSNVVTEISDIVDYDISEPLGTVAINEKYQETYAFWNVRTNDLVQAGEGVEDAVEGFDGELTLYKMFRWLGNIQPGQSSAGGELTSKNLQYASCLYAVTENLGAHTTLTLTAKLQTNGNEAGDLYGNIAHSWKQGDARTGSNLTSNQVWTRVVGREISGLVWEDVNQDGVRNKVGDEDEPLIENATCTLFKWDENQEKYVQVEGGGGANGRRIVVTKWDENKKEYVQREIEEDEPVQMTTESDGSYHFSNLADGDYVVAFSGDVLEKYDGETKYQVNSSNDDNTSDGVENSKSEYKGIDSNAYPYCIQYSTIEKNKNIHLHTLDEIKANTALLTSGIESIDHQDLGLVVNRYELPETGGSGSLPYQAGGLALILAAAGLRWIYRRKASITR